MPHKGRASIKMRKEMRAAGKLLNFASGKMPQSFVLLTDGTAISSALRPSQIQQVMSDD